MKRAFALALAVLAGSACQPSVRRVPKPEPAQSLRVAEVRRVSDRVATSNASWSPDGNAVVFGTADGLVVVDLRGPVRQVASLRNATRVDWSRAGRWVAVVSGGSLWVVDLDRPSWRRVDLPGVVRAFRWSPAGDRGAAVVEDRGGAWLWLISAQGGVRRSLFGPSSALYDLGWYPDGLYVSVRAQDRPDKAAALWRVRVAGPDHRPVEALPATTLQAELSPTGRAVAYVTLEEEGAALVVQEVGGRPRPALARGAGLWGVSWSPQGDKLSYAEVEAGERAVVWMVDPRGGRAVRLADYALEFPDPGALVGTAWSPTGRAVAFGTGFAQRAGPVWVVRLERR